VVPCRADEPVTRRRSLPVYLGPGPAGRARALAQRLNRPLASFLRGFALCRPPKALLAAPRLKPHEMPLAPEPVDSRDHGVMEAITTFGDAGERELGITTAADAVRAFAALRRMGMRWDGEQWHKEERISEEAARALYRSFRKAIADSTTPALGGMVTVRLSKEEEEMLPELARKANLPVLAYMRVCVLSDGERKKPKGFPTGSYHQIYMDTSEIEEVNNAAARAKMTRHRYLRTRVVNGFDVRDIFDLDGSFKLWTLDSVF